MKALFLNITAQTITQIELSENYKDISKAIGNDCHTFSCPIEFDNRDTMYCDDEGLLKEVHGGIRMEDWAYPISGNIVILGTDDEGNSIDAQTTIEELTPLITWVGKEEMEMWQSRLV